MVTFDSKNIVLYPGQNSAGPTSLFIHPDRLPEINLSLHLSPCLRASIVEIPQGRNAMIDEDREETATQDIKTRIQPFQNVHQVGSDHDAGTAHGSP